ncbi:MAG TPA: hypothetical protein VGM63_12885 [Mucilaginibacter sp.]|jgi:hypothetical protein
MDFPFDTIGLDATAIESFHETFKALKAKFRIELTGHIDFHLENFELFKHYDDVIVRDSYVIKQGSSDCYILFLEVTYRVDGGRVGCHYRREYHTLALAYLKKDFGRVMIRPETLTDKLLELIHPIELDFAEDKAFSDTFYVLVNDHQKAVNAIDRNFRNAVMDVREKDLVIEVVNHTLIIGNCKTIVPEDAINLAEFVVRVCSSC